MVKYNGKKIKRQKLPRTVVVIYVLMIIVLLGICAGVFIALYSDVLSSTESTDVSPSALIITPESSYSSESRDAAAEISDSLSKISDISSESGDSSPESGGSDAESVPLNHSDKYDAEFFSQDLFIGDSIFSGLYLYNFISMDNVAAAVGLSPATADAKVLDDKEMTALQYAQQMQPTRIYIMLGSNAMAGTYSTELEKSYLRLLDELETACPDSEICCISVTPVTDDTDYTNLDNETIRKFNGFIGDLCAERGIAFCDLYSLVSDSDGYFLDEYAEIDGLHFQGKTYVVMLAELERIMEEQEGITEE